MFVCSTSKLLATNFSFIFRICILKVVEVCYKYLNKFFLISIFATFLVTLNFSSIFFTIQCLRYTNKNGFISVLVIFQSYTFPFTKNKQNNNVIKTELKQRIENIMTVGDFYSN